MSGASPAVRTLLGTPLDVARDDDRQRTLICADLHLETEDAPEFAAFEALLAKARAEAAATRLLILGDLFEFYVTPGQLGRGIWRAVASRLAEVAAAGVSLTVLRGNRDFMLGRTFAERARCRVPAGGLWLRLGGEAGIVVHGDELLVRDLPYRRAKRLLRHPLTTALLRRLPVGVATRLAIAARRRSVRSTSRPAADAGDGGPPMRFRPTAASLAAAAAAGARHLVHGHVHRAAHGTVAAASGVAGDYWVLPAFDGDGIHLDWPADAAAPTFRDRAGGVRPEPGPAMLAPEGLPGPAPAPGRAP